MSDNNTDRDLDSAKPEDTDFRQQRLRAWQPLLTPKWVILTFVLIGIIFIPIGVAVLYASDDVVEISQRYDNLPCADSNIPNTDPCQKVLTFNIEKDMDGPVYFYYKLTNFYQNHRRYVQSRSDPQLSGESSPDTSTCDPLEKFNDKTLYPCGLIANSIFNDVFTATVNGNALTGNDWNKENIAWSTDKNTKFDDLYDPVTSKPLPNDLTREGPNGVMPDLKDTELMVWMRPAGVSTFRKLNRVVASGFKKGDVVTLTVQDKYKVASFDGSKSAVFSTVSWVGGKNYFLAYTYIVTGSISLLFALIFGIKQIVAPRKMGELKVD